MKNIKNLNIPYVCALGLLGTTFMSSTTYAAELSELPSVSSRAAVSFAATSTEEFDSQKERTKKYTEELKPYLADIGDKVQKMVDFIGSVNATVNQVTEEIEVCVAKTGLPSASLAQAPEGNSRQLLLAKVNWFADNFRVVTDALTELKSHYETQQAEFAEHQRTYERALTEQRERFENLVRENDRLALEYQRQQAEYLEHQRGHHNEIQNAFEEAQKIDEGTKSFLLYI